jgi:integrase
LNPEQLKRLFEVWETEPNKDVVNFMKMVLFTGMRPGELFKLQWKDIDFEHGFIHIRNPKGVVSQQIPLNKSARGVLMQQPKQKSPFVFPGKHGRRRTTYRRHANRIKARAGLPKEFRALYGLRHVYASMLASSGKIDMYTLQKLMTHKDFRMTQRYAHLRDEALKKAADVADSLIDEIGD